MSDMGVTGNSRVMLGYVVEALRSLGNDPMYQVVEADAHAGTAIIECVHNGNTYRLSAVQISGSE